MQLKLMLVLLILHQLVFIYQIKKQKESIKTLVVAQDKAIAENKDQYDLYYLSSILVSTGWNKNDDVFDLGETWGAKDTPSDKQFNFMHDEADIIGHITGSVVLDSRWQ
jgi:hypothetical protein